MTLAVDASTPAVAAWTHGLTSMASNTFSPPANSVVVVVVAVDGPGGGVSQSVSSMTDSLGSHLTWSNVWGGVTARSNTVSLAVLENAVEFWWAACPSAQTNMTVTPTLAHASGGAHDPDGLLQPVVFTGAATTQNGAVGTLGATTAQAPSKAVTTTANNSWVFGSVANYDNGTAPTVGTAQTTTINAQVSQELNTTDGDGYWAQQQNATTPTSGTVVTINDTAPSIHFNMVVVEIVPLVVVASYISPRRYSQAVARAAFR